MAEKRNYWLKLNEDYFTSPKIKKLRRVAGGDTLTIIYLKMQLLSISENGIIMFEGIEKTFEEELSLKLDEQLDDIQLLMSFLRNQELVEENGNEFLLPEACKKIGSECESAERVRVFRERKNRVLLQCNEPVTGVLHSSISISNSISNSKSFIIPTIEEVTSYCKERNNNVNPEKWWNFYNSKNWYVGKNKMKNWKSAIITWEKDTKQEENKFASLNLGTVIK